MDEKLVNFRNISLVDRRKAPKRHNDLPGAIILASSGKSFSCFPPEA
jgi:hypothetical protein